MNTTSAPCSCGEILLGECDCRSATVSAPKTAWGRLALAGALAAAAECFDALLAWETPLFGLEPQTWLGGAGEWLPMIFAAGAVVFAGMTTYKEGWTALKNLDLNMNALMAVAVTGAFCIGQYPEAAMVMVLFTIAEAVEEKSLDKARNAVAELLDLTPEKATVQCADGSWAETDIRLVSVGDRVRVRPGERVALDGVVVLGRSSVNQAPVTGESMPVEKNIGDGVYAGSINESGSFAFEVGAGADNSTTARILHAIEDAQASRAPIQRFVDRFARYYTPAVFLAALLVGIVPPLFMCGAWKESVYTALVILVIGCPCALVISTPVTVVGALAAAARRGILIKGGIFLEQGGRLRTLALDKTGTLTYGKPRLTEFIALDGDRVQASALAASLAVRSDHPLSKAVAEDAAEKETALLEVFDFTAVPGQGVSGVINGRKWRMGKHRAEEEPCSAETEEMIASLERQGKSVTVLSGEAGVRAVFAAADTLKQSAVEAVGELKKLGLRTVMLTGDNEYTARAVAEQAGVDEYRGNLLPEDKLAVIKQLMQKAKVGMVGDGINDGPALAGADIGFAVAVGTDTAVESADVVLMGDDLRKIPCFIRLSRAARVILGQNITLALGVKAAFLALTFWGQASMWAAVFADVGTCLLVIANGLRALRL